MLRSRTTLRKRLLSIKVSQKPQVTLKRTTRQENFILLNQSLLDVSWSFLNYSIPSMGGLRLSMNVSFFTLTLFVQLKHSKVSHAEIEHLGYKSIPR